MKKGQKVKVSPIKNELDATVRVAGYDDPCRVESTTGGGVLLTVRGTQIDMNADEAMCMSLALHNAAQVSKGHGTDPDRVLPW